MTKISTKAAPVVLLDVMGTLVRDPFYEDVPAFLGMDLETLLAVMDPQAWVDFELGRCDEDEMVARFFRDRRSVDGAGLRECVRSGLAWLAGMEELLREMRAEGLEMHALSNYGPWYRMIEEKLGLSRFLHWSFVSCDTGHRKPASEAYLVAARRLARPVEEFLFVDDRAENCAAAVALGMQTVRFRSSGALREELYERSLLGR